MALRCGGEARPNGLFSAPAVRVAPDTREKLAALADASRYDLSCACGGQNEDHRRRGPAGVWVYPTAVPRGGDSIMLKTLLSSACAYDCRYCPLRAERSVPRYILAPEELAEAFMGFARRGGIHGLFLSSGVVRSPDYTMERMLAVLELLRRRHSYRGFLHLKIIPGASEAAIERALALANAVSLNVEAPTRAAFAPLSGRKDYQRDIVQPIRFISRLTAPGRRYAGVKQTTQFLVGASHETDEELLKATFGLYRRLGLARVYFSAYQQGLGDPAIPGERRAPERGAELLTREHRLYQADFLIRKYRWGMEDICFEPGGGLSLKMDPKQSWAERHPEFFPVRLRTAERPELLRVPGIGPLTAARILQGRREGPLRDLRQAGLRGGRLATASRYVVAE